MIYFCDNLNGSEFSLYTKSWILRLCIVQQTLYNSHQFNICLFISVLLQKCNPPKLLYFNFFLHKESYPKSSKLIFAQNHSNYINLKLKWLKLLFIHYFFTVITISFKPIDRSKIWIHVFLRYFNSFQLKEKK